MSNVPKPDGEGLIRSDTGTGPDTLKLFEEVARLEKRNVVTGRVRVTTRTETVEETVRDTLEGQTVEISHVPLDRMLLPGEPVPQVRTEGEVTIIPVLEEVLVVEKRLVLKEELRVLRRSEKEMFEQTVPLHRQSAVVEHFDTSEATHPLKGE